MCVGEKIEEEVEERGKRRIERGERERGKR